MRRYLFELICSSAVALLSIYISCSHHCLTRLPKFVVSTYEILFASVLFSMVSTKIFDIGYKVQQNMCLAELTFRFKT